MKALYIIPILITSFFLTVNLIKQFITKAYSNGYLDTPNNRKLQKKAIPTSGGIPMYLGLIITTLVSFLFGYISLNEIIITFYGGLMLILGFVDDLKNLKAKTRFLIEIVIGIAIAASGYRIINFYGFIGIYELPLIWQYSITVFGFILIVNAFNLIDGVDGLLGGISLINMSVLASIFLFHNQLALFSFCLVVCIVLLAFLTMNYNPAKIFMGDAGSLFLGTITTILVLELANIKNNNTSFYYIVVFAMIMIPVFDTLRVFMIRILRKKSPFSADQNHAHHYLIKFGYNHKKVTTYMYMSHIFMLIVPFILYKYLGNDTFVVLLIVAICLSEVITYKKVILHKLYKINKRIRKQEILKETPFIQKHL